MHFSEARNRKLVDTAKAETIGEVEGFIVDPGRQAITALRLRKLKGVEGSVVDWSALHAFGSDAVTIDGSEAIREPTDDAERGSPELVGHRVLTDAGLSLGLVSDVDFDPSTGAIVAVLTEAESVEGRRILGLGTYALVVADGE